MCGLVGVVAKTTNGFYASDKDIFTQMLYADAVRGKDATGAYGVTKLGNVRWLKQASTSGYFIQNKAYEQFEAEIVTRFHAVIGHNRKATHGEKKDKDAHPFIKDHITLVHNGMIRNHKSLCAESTVDSNAVANALAHTDAKEVLRNIDGAFAFIWYNAKEKKVHFIRNKERPLSYVETDRAWYIASESLLAGWCIIRNNQKILQKVDCEEDTLYSIDIDTKQLTVEKLDLKKVASNDYTGFYSYLNPDDGDDEKASLFLDKETVKFSPIIWAERNQELHAEIVEYEDYLEPTFNKTVVELTCKVLNCDLAGPTITAFVPIKDMEKYLKTCVIHGIVQHISYHHTKGHQILLSGVTPSDIIETKNGMFITDEMWLSDHFPTVCTKCKKNQIKKSELTDAYVSFSYSHRTSVDMECLCTSCQEQELQCINA